MCNDSIESVGNNNNNNNQPASRAFVIIRSLYVRVCVCVCVRVCYCHILLSLSLVRKHKHSTHAIELVTHYIHTAQTFHTIHTQTAFPFNCHRFIFDVVKVARRLALQTRPKIRYYSLERISTLSASSVYVWGFIEIRAGLVVNHIFFVYCRIDCS